MSSEIARERQRELLALAGALSTRHETSRGLPRRRPHSLVRPLVLRLAGIPAPTRAAQGC